MSNPTCELVAERIALGEPLAELDAHARSCERCKRVLELPAKLGATGHAADPGIGFSSRVTAGAQHRIVVRRRRRIATLSALSVAAAAVMTLVVMHKSGTPAGPTAAATDKSEKTKPAVAPREHDPWQPRQVEVDPDVRALVHLADKGRDFHVSADWGRIEKPLRPYKAVLEGKEP
ncbi:MAG TPA: hypothetical protein VGL61_12315 [Kofleriaceae bacterium]|jgi:hypothetical protein